DRQCLERRDLGAAGVRDHPYPHRPYLLSSQEREAISAARRAGLQPVEEVADVTAAVSHRQTHHPASIGVVERLGDDAPGRGIGAMTLADPEATQKVSELGQGVRNDLLGIECPRLCSEEPRGGKPECVSIAGPIHCSAERDEGPDLCVRGTLIAHPFSGGYL